MNRHNDLLRACRPPTKWYVLVAGGVITLAVCIMGAISFIDVS